MHFFFFSKTSLGHFIIIQRLKTRRWEGGIKLERGVGSIVYRTINSGSINPALVPQCQ